MRDLRRSGRLAALGVTIALGLTACASGADVDSQDLDAPTGSEEVTTADPSPRGSPEAHEEGDRQDPFAALQQAATHVGETGTAKALASGVAEAAGLEGDIETPAVQTYATLSTLLQEHVYLSGIAVDVGLSSGLDSSEFEAAAATLDGSSVELSEVVGSVAGDEKAQAFLSLWRAHIGFFVDYAKGTAEGDEQVTQQALDNLNQYRQQAGAFFEEVTGGALPADAVAESLTGHIDTLTAAIDAAADGDPAVFVRLKEAATHVGESGTAKALASGVAEAAGLEGDIESPAAQAYATLSTLLEEHVYLSGIAVKTAYAAGPDTPQFEAAAATLDESSAELSEVVGAVAGDEKAQ
ncbi:MAG: hypothetical protein ACRDUY_04365, partial [Nitriliruptorales bacterium]